MPENAFTLGDVETPSSFHEGQAKTIMSENSPSDSATSFFANWQEVGYPCVTGRDDQGAEIKAREFVKHYLYKKWRKHKEEKLFARAGREVYRLNKEYPGLRDEVYEEVKDEVRNRNST